MKRIILLTFMFFSFFAIGQKQLLLSGPMLGYLTMHEAMVWVQTKESANVQIAYYPLDEKGNPTDTLWSNTFRTSEITAYTAHIVLNKIKPSTKYHYEVFINGQKVNLDFPTEFKTKAIWRYRTNPPDFSFAAGSGTYINDPQWDRPRPYGGGYEIYKTVYDKHPDFVLWLGDNVYLRQNEWNSWTGIVYRYTHDRQLPELQPLLANSFNYAIWDDHDFGPNDSDGSFPFKNLTLRAFELFWANPSYGVGDIKGAITFFNWNDVDFFLLDNRYYRDPDNLKDTNKTQLGKEQLEWLKRALVFSKASFKVVVIGGQFLNPNKVYETYANHGFNKERQEIIDFIYKQKIYNVVFITGDRHHTELNVLEKQGEPTIYDITLSPFNSRPNKYAVNEKNPLRVPGTLVSSVRNFGLIKVTGPQKKRKMIVTVFDKDGNELWKYTIKRELTPKRVEH